MEFGDGEAIYTNKPELEKVIRSIANHGMKEKYHYDRIGVNSRLDSLQAAILEVKLKYFDDHLKARKKVAIYYDEHLAEIEEIQIPMRSNYSTHTFHQYTIKTDRRDDLQQFLKSKDIPTMIYYPKPIHLQKGYLSLGYKMGDFPNAEKLADTVLSIPMHTELDEDQVKYIVTSLKEFFSKNR